MSFGVQDLEPMVQRAINRVQPAEHVEQVYRWARELGFASINLDLIVGLLHQTAARFAPTLDTVLGWQPDRFSIFAYAHVPWMKKNQKLIRESDHLIFPRLTEAGYVNIGLDHDAKLEDDRVQAQRNHTLWRNFQGYTTYKHCDIYGFGASSISQTLITYAQNNKNLRRYQTGVAADGLCGERGVVLARDDSIRRDAITHVMCDLALDGAAFGQVWGVDCWDYFAASLPDLRAQAQDGLIKLEGSKLNVTELGRRFLRNIAMCFDGYLGGASAPVPRYSRTL